MPTDNYYWDKTWKNYEDGFGEVGQDYWLGLTEISRLTNIAGLKWRLEVVWLIMFQTPNNMLSKTVVLLI